MEQNAAQLAAEGDKPWRHTAGALLAGVSLGDVVWVVSFEARRPFLIARIPADHVVDGAEAARLLSSASLWEAPWHVISDAQYAQLPSIVELADLVSELRFMGRANRIPADFDHQHFRALRTLAAESVPLFEARWAARHDWQVDSQRAAAAILARILPTAERRTWLIGWFAHAVEIAHELAPSRWCVILHPDRARLYVNWTIVCTLHLDQIWMQLNRGVLSLADRAALSAEPGWSWDKEDESQVEPEAGTGAGYLAGIDDDDDAALILQRALARRIARSASGTGLRASVRTAWAPGLLEAIEGELDRPLPRPSWLDATPTDNERSLRRMRKGQRGRRI